MNTTFFEAGNDIVPDFLSVDANSDIAGDWINISNYERAYWLVMAKAGTAGDDISIELRQATSAAGGGAKALNFERLWYKKGTLNTVGQWTAVKLTTPTNDLDTVSVNGEDITADNVDAVFMVEVKAEDLDVNNGFRFVQGLIEGDDLANARLLTGAWVMHSGKYCNAVPVSAIA